MTRDKAEIAVALLNSYAHQYLGLTYGHVIASAGARKDGVWSLIIATPGSAREAKGFDEAKAIIDQYASQGPVDDTRRKGTA